MVDYNFSVSFQCFITQLIRIPRFEHICLIVFCYCCCRHFVSRLTLCWFYPLKSWMVLAWNVWRTSFSYMQRSLLEVFLWVLLPSEVMSRTGLLVILPHLWSPLWNICGEPSLMSFIRLAKLTSTLLGFCSPNLPMATICCCFPQLLMLVDFSAVLWERDFILLD